MIFRRTTLVLLSALLAALTMGRAQTPPPIPLTEFSGHYVDPSDPDGGFSLYVEEGKLLLTSERALPIVLTPSSGNTFTISGYTGSVNFLLDAAGRPDRFAFTVQPEAVYQRTGEAIHYAFHDYVRTEAMIPMRDGVKLHAVILKPSDISVPLPILMERTPYGAQDTTRASFYANRPELAREGYIEVVEDIRGRYQSKGKFVMSRPMADHSNPHAVDESTDAWDTVDWLVKNVAGNNGRVGLVGTSYPGFLATAAGIDPHPAVKAISPQAPMIDVWMGDDFFHNGAFRQSYGYDYVRMMETNKQQTEVSYGKDANGKDVDGFDYFLSRGSFLADVKQSGSRKLPTWKLFLNHPAYDTYWRSRGVEYSLHTVAVPTLSVGGYYDQEDMYGPQAEYAALEPHDAHQQNFLVLGPWRHGYWTSSSRHLGKLNYGEPIGTEFRQQIEARFFAHYLKDVPGFNLIDTASFQTGSNTWQHYAHFPPAAAKSTSLHLAGAGVLGWQTPSTAQTSYTSDPAHPVPYRHRPIQPTYSADSTWYNWLTEDQRFVADRNDVAIWKLPVLTSDLTLTGEVVADIFASTSASDMDLVVKLIDQYPEDDPDPAMRGYQLLTNADIFRGRYLAGFDTPAPLAAGPHEFKFSLHDVDHVFKAGHTVLIEIQSTWFPLYDRNPQKFVPNIMKAKPADYQSATITIESGPGQDSSLLLPVVR